MDWGASAFLSGDRSKCLPHQGRRRHSAVTAYTLLKCRRHSIFHRPEDIAIINVIACTCIDATRPHSRIGGYCLDFMFRWPPNQATVSGIIVPARCWWLHVCRAFMDPMVLRLVDQILAYELLSFEVMLSPPCFHPSCLLHPLVHFVISYHLAVLRFLYYFQSFV